MLRNIRYSMAPSKSSPPTTISFWWSVAMLGNAFAALREGLAASREYQQLRSLGVSHDMAIREALGLYSSAPAAMHGACPIYFAGKG